MECFMEQAYIALILDVIICGLSFILSLVIIVIISKEKLYETYSFRILFYISINDLLRSLIGFFDSMVYKNSFACWMFAYLDVFFTISNMVWAFCLTFTIYQIIVLEETSFEKYHKVWFFVSYILVPIIEALPFSTLSYGYDEGICQLIKNETGEIWRFSLIYAPLLIVFIIIIILFNKIIRKIELLGNISIIGLVFDRGLIYSLIISVIQIPFFMIRVVQIFENGCIIQCLVMLMIVLINLQGFLNGLAFFYIKSVRSILLRSFYQINASNESENSSLQVSFASEISNS